MDKKPNVLEQAFDLLSSIAYLNIRQLLKGLWVFSTVFFGFSILVEGVAIFTGRAEFRWEWIKNLVMWAGVNPFFAYTLYLWNKRERLIRANPEKPH